ncbi:hypothetical protein DPEC_G00214320 [Dallia pectoralis]|uniref:Uncharacterized protein n=1 Tax=Dallia pectoralis TaxID=75939 RepID=A0ACC2G222_DALPE|nr:hypothetical protein DPEC_G00214320 [Dallia pectoralis]
MSLDEQLKELLEMLDLSSAMKSSPSRSKRLKLLKKTIADVRGEIYLVSKSPAVASCEVKPAETEEEPLPLSEQEEEGPSLSPPKLEPLNSSPPAMNPDSHSEPPTLKPVDADDTPKTPSCDDVRTETTPSLPREPINGLISNPLLPVGDLSVVATSVLAKPSVTGSVVATSVLAKPSATGSVVATSVLAKPSVTGGVVATSVLAKPVVTGNRRTNVLFRKSKSSSPQKAPRTVEHLPCPPPLGAKTFLSVVIPRLETLLLPRKRTHSVSGECDEDEESPIKRLDTGLANGFVVEPETMASPSRPLEPRRRSASESSISSSGSMLCSTSTVRVTKNGKGRSSVVRRSTVDDKNTLITCIGNGDFTKAAKIAADHPPQDAQNRESPPRDLPPPASAGRPPGRRTDAVQVRRETLPRPLLRQQAQLAMAS